MIFVVAECERKETVMTDAEEEVFIVEDPEEENKRETLLRNGEVRVPLPARQSINVFCKQQVDFIL